LTAGNYTIKVINTVGCISGDTSITINAQPATPVKPSVSVVHPTCTLSTGTIAVTAPLGSGMKYVVVGASSTDTITATSLSGLTEGNYTVKVINAFGCISGDTTVTINTQPTLPAKPIFIVGDTLLSAEFKQTYSVANQAGVTSYSWSIPANWSGSSTTNTINVITGNKSGYIAVVAISNGCNSDTAKLYVNLKQTIITPVTILEESTITICDTNTYTGIGNSVPPTVATCMGTTKTIHGSIDTSNYPSCISYTRDSNYVGKDTACYILCKNGVCDTVIYIITILF
jgi:hypothetical protein